MTVKEKYSQWISRLSPEDPMFQELQKAADDPAEIAFIATLYSAPQDFAANAEPEQIE